MPKSRNPKIEFDYLQMYFGEPYIIDIPDASGVITIYQPTIGDIIRIGEKRFYQSLNIFITNTTSYRLPLWKNKIDWNIMSDFELFTMLLPGVDPMVTPLIFGDLDLTKFQRSIRDKGEKKEITLYDADDDIEINEAVYHHISQYLRNVFNMFPEEKITTDSILKQWYIDKDKRQAKIDEYKKEKGTASDSFSIQPMVSTYVNHPGTKYKLKELKEVGVCEFYDSIQRLPIYESTTACMKGLYSGFVDGKKIKPEDYNIFKKIKRA